MLAPMFGAYLILGRSKGGTAEAGTILTQAERLADAQSVILPYGLVAVALLVLAVIIARFPLPAMGAATSRVSREERKHHSLWRHRNLVWGRSEEHTSELQSLMRISYAVFCLKKKNTQT